jgi:BirA family biotin operon repressor/biotin-[acetyl-CoA-carboxylase] ligase
VFDSRDYAVLEVLARAQSDYVPAAVVAEAAHPVVEKIVEPIERLIRLGVPVESHPVYGFRLPVSFDLIDRHIVSEKLKAKGIDWPVHGRLETGSTNDLANSAAAEGAPDGTTFFAEHQTQGRGRLGRAWHSPVGSGLWFSVLRRHDLPIEEGWRVTLGAGLAVAEAVAGLTDLDPKLKWPNDVLIEGRKVAGILTESRMEANRLKHSIVGIGMNVHLDQSDFPPELRDIAVSVKSAGASVSRGDLLVEILALLKDAVYQDPSDLRAAWSDRCTHWGERVRVERDQGTVEGKAIELAEDGSFVIELDDATLFPVHAGDVTHLRMET